MKVEGHMHQLAHASFGIHGDKLDPNFWTEYFNIKPEAWRIRGEFYKTPSGRMSKFPARVGCWGISSRHQVQSDLLNPHIDYLLSRVGLPRADLGDLLIEHAATMRIFCYWDNYAGDRIPTIHTEYENIVIASGGTIEVDLYPQKHTFRHQDGSEEEVRV